jgi:hypothetical protein
VLSLEESLFEWVGLLIRAIILMVFKSVFFGFSYPRKRECEFWLLLLFNDAKLCVFDLETTQEGLFCLTNVFCSCFSRYKFVP